MDKVIADIDIQRTSRNDDRKLMKPIKTSKPGEKIGKRIQFI